MNMEIKEKQKEAINHHVINQHNVITTLIAALQARIPLEEEVLTKDLLKSMANESRIATELVQLVVWQIE